MKNYTKGTNFNSLFAKICLYNYKKVIFEKNIFTIFIEHAPAL